MASKADRAIDLISQIEEDAKAGRLKDILIDLEAYAGPERHTEGYLAAIDVIKSNYGIK